MANYDAILPNPSPVPEWTNRRAAQLTTYRLARTEELDESADARGGRVFDFHGMTPDSAARQLDRIFRARELADSAIESFTVADSFTPAGRSDASVAEHGQPSAPGVSPQLIKPVSYVTGAGAPSPQNEQERDRIMAEQQEYWKQRNPNPQPKPMETQPNPPAKAPNSPAPNNTPAPAPKQSAPAPAPERPDIAGPDNSAAAPEAHPERVESATTIDPETVRRTPMLQGFYNLDGTPKQSPMTVPTEAQQAFDQLPSPQRAVIEQTMSGQVTFEHKPQPASPGPTITEAGPPLGRQPVERVTNADGSQSLVVPVQGRDGLSRIVFGPDGITVIDPDGTRTPVNSQGIAPPRRTHANRMFDPELGAWIMPPPETPKGLVPEVRHSPWLDAVTDLLDGNGSTTKPSVVIPRSDGSTEVRTPGGGSAGADRPWTEVRILDADGREIAYYREGSDGNKHYPLGAGHDVTIGPDGKVVDPPHLSPAPLDAIGPPDRRGRIGYIEPDGWTTALEPIPLPPGVPGQALYAHDGRLLIRDTNGKYHWVDQTPETPSPTPSQRSIIVPWDAPKGVDSYRTMDGTWYFDVNGHKVAFTPDQQQVIDIPNGLRPTGTGGIYVDDRNLRPESIVTAVFPIPSKQIPVPEGVPATALYELEDGRLVVVDREGGNHYVSPLPALPPEGWVKGLVRAFMDVALTYGGRKGGWAAAPGRPYPRVLEPTAPWYRGPATKSGPTKPGSEDAPSPGRGGGSTVKDEDASQVTDNKPKSHTSVEGETEVVSTPDSSGKNRGFEEPRLREDPPGGQGGDKPPTGSGSGTEYSTGSTVGRAKAPGDSPSAKPANGIDDLPTVRELFDTDEGELRGILQCGLDGEYGLPDPNEGWRLRLQVDHVESTRNTRTGRPYLEFGATIRDGAGNDVGRVMRAFTIDSDGDPVVEHAWLRLDKSVRGRNFSSDLFKTLLRYYRRSDVSAITLFASLDDGGWAWAKAGFRWDNTGPKKEQGNRASMLEQIQEVRTDPNVSEADKALLDGLADRFAGPSERWPTPFEMTRLASQDPSLAERILRGSSWYGVMWL
ncbi:hypothetical protein [Nocardia arthritidis]|uniref:Uncharacterized protein n=1 Tax=Nocardia arthritidis TaxID=228602 RepID=A0A6G9YSB4_9NOCA|nr:hypothetical protein [Nocardia arthritidis]QIS16094.1 hypothetical protein F5544_41420 [Nocardia arthritidis]